MYLYGEKTGVFLEVLNNRKCFIKTFDFAIQCICEWDWCFVKNVELHWNSILSCDEVCILINWLFVNNISLRKPPDKKGSSIKQAFPFLLFYFFFFFGGGSRYLTAWFHMFKMFKWAFCLLAPSGALVVISSVRSSSGYHGLLHTRSAQPTFSDFSNSSDSKVKVKVKGPKMCYIFEKHGIQGYRIWHSRVSNVKYTNTRLQKYANTQIQSA